MTKVIAITSFDHGGKRRRGDEFDVSDQVAEALQRKGLVRLAENPSKKSSEQKVPARKTAGGEKKAQKGAD